MAAKTGKQINDNHSSVIGIMIFIMASVSILFMIIPNTGILINKNLTKGYIYETSRNYCHVYYVNKFDSKKYFLDRKIDSRLENYLKFNDKSVVVSYSKFFPNNASLYNLENNRSILSVFLIIIILGTNFYVIKNDLFK